MIIKKDEVEKLAKLSRIALPEEEKDSLVADLGKILNHFEELKELNETSAKPIAGGATEKNITRYDEDDAQVPVSRDALIRAFPEREGDFLKVPAVFEK